MRWLKRRRPARPPRPVRLVVIEHGAETSRIHRPADDGEETIVIGQGTEETTLELVFRVLRRLAALEQSGRRVVSPVLRVSSHFDDQSMAARNVLIRALLTHSAILGSSELLLAASDELSSKLRMRLLELVEELIGESIDCSTGIRIQFGDVRAKEAPLSGTFACATPEPDAETASLNAASLTAGTN